MTRRLLIRTLTIGFGFLTLYYLVESLFNIFYFYPSPLNSLQGSSFAQIESNLIFFFAQRFSLR